MAFIPLPKHSRLKVWKLIPRIYSACYLQVGKMQRNNAARALRSDYRDSWREAASRILEEGGDDAGPLLQRRSTDSVPGTQGSIGE